MKRKIGELLFVILFSLIHFACEEDFNPKAELKNLYVFNCTVVLYNNLSDSNPGPLPSIKAALTRTYDTDGFIPKSPDSSLFVPKANIYFFQSIKEFQLTDSMVFHAKSGDIISRYKYYFWSELVPPLKGNDQCRISARMPDGTVLNASTVTPRPLSFDLSRAFNHGITGNVNKFYAGNELTFSWGDPVKSSHLYFPKFVINARVAGKATKLKIEIPTKFIKRNDKFQPLYAGAVNVPYVSYEYSSIDSAMKNATSGLYKPSEIIIDNCSLTVTEYDNNLSALYSSTNGYMDGYSVRLDENVYSNINGGLGVFGSCMVNLEIFPVDREYIRSFGYSTGDE